MLQLMLEKRKQKPDEQCLSYINAVESWCKRIDKNMSQREILRNIMKSLKPAIVRCIGILENKTLDEFKKNLRKYELIEFMTAESIDKNKKTHMKLKKRITQNKIQ